MSSSDPLAQLKQELADCWSREQANYRRALLEQLRQKGRDHLDQLARDLEAWPQAEFDVGALLEGSSAGRIGFEGLDGVFSAVRLMDRAAHQGAVLEILLSSALQFADRVAVLLTRTDGIEVWGSQGWSGESADLLAGRRLDTSAKVLERLARGCGVIRAEPSELPELAVLFGASLPAEAVLVPLVLRDHLAAALYADRVRSDLPLVLKALQILVLLAQQRLELQALSHRLETPTLWLESELSGAGLPLWDPQAVVRATVGAAGVAASEVGEPAAAFLEESVAPFVEEPAAAFVEERQALSVTSEELAPAESAASAAPEEQVEALVFGTESDTEAAVAFEEEEPTGSWLGAPRAEEPAPAFAAAASYEVEPPLLERDRLGEGATPSAAPPEVAETPDSFVAEFELVPEVELPREPAEVTAPLVGAPSLESSASEGTPWSRIEEGPVSETFQVSELEPPPPPTKTLDLPPIGPPPEAVVQPPAPPVGLETRAMQLGSAILETPPPSWREPEISEDATVLVRRPQPEPVPGQSEDATLLVRRPEAEPTPDLSKDATVLVRRESPAPELPRIPAPPSPELPIREPRPDPSAAETSAESTSGGSSTLDQTQSRRAPTEVVPPPDVEGPGLAFRPGGFERRTSGDPLHEEARRLARLLISEIKLYNEEQVEEGRRNRDLYHRLREDIDRSRQIYEERVHESVRATVDYFQQELIRSLAGGDPRALGI